MGRNPDLNENSAEQASPVGVCNTGGIAPQASSVIGTPAPPPQTIESVGCSQAYTVLNPYGATNRMHEGAIMFDLPKLCFSQYMDVDTQFEITDDMSPGSVILQIPYTPLGDYMNPFIRLFAGLHERYNGDILVRIQLIGNATYSGTLMWFWYPTEYPTNIVTFAEAQKYEYKTMSVVMPSVEAFVLRDARQQQYYRLTSDSDIKNRPHLVLCIHTTVVSPLREGIKVRARVGSKLASETDAMIAGVPIQPFVLTNPVLNSITPENKSKSLNNMTVGEVFPYYNRRSLYGVVDGTTILPSYSYLDSVGKILDFTLKTPIPGLFGGDFPQTNYKRLFTSATTYGTVEANQCRMVLVIHQLDADLEKKIATDTDFISIPENAETWLSKFKEAQAIQKYVSADVIRTQQAVTAIWTDPDHPAVVLKIMCQLHLVTRNGMMLALALQYENSSRDFDASKKIGIPNSSSGSLTQLPFNPVLGPVTHTGTLVTLPTPWFGFKFVDTPTSIVTGNDEIAPTTVTSATILDYFMRVTDTTTSDQAFQFDLVDPTSKVRVMTLRYLPSLQNFVINAIDNIRYREYQGDITKLLFANAGNIPLATSMPLTDTSAWPKRFPTSLAQITSTSNSNRLFKFNAAAALLVGEEAELGSAFTQLESSQIFRGASSAISDDLWKGWTHPVSRDSLVDTTKYFVNSNGARYPTNTSVASTSTEWPVNFSNRTLNLFKPSRGTQSNASYTRSKGTLTDAPWGTSQGTQAGTSAATVRGKYIQTDRTTNQATKSTQFGGDPGLSNRFSLEKFNPILKYYSAFAGTGSPSDYDRFVYTSSRDSMRANGNAVISGEYNRAMQSNQNEWQGSQNDKQRQFTQEQNQQKYTHENEMQQAGFRNSQQMQNAGFAHDLDMQRNTFSHDITMQNNKFGFEQQNQARQFAHDTDMSNLGFEHNKALGKQQIVGGLLNTATGGAFSLANTAVSKGADLYMQQRNFHNSQALMTQNFNQSMFASGASSQALKLAG